MKTTQQTPAYSRKPVLRRVSPEFKAVPSANAIGRLEPASFRRPLQPGSPVISRAAKNAGQTIYELLGMAELMRVAFEKGELASVQERLSLLREKAADLASDISEIFEFAGLEAESPRKSCSQLDIVALLHDVSEEARLLVGDKPVAVMDVLCNRPVVIHSDPVRLRRILTGLLRNAAKFTERGRITVILGEDDDTIRLTVADTGRGMTPEQVHAVLEAADLGHDVEMNGLKESDLGLSIVHALVKKLGGCISLSSKQGEGTIVEVSLPR